MIVFGTWLCISHVCICISQICICICMILFGMWIVHFPDFTPSGADLSPWKQIYWDDLLHDLTFFCNPVSAILLHWLFITICEIYWNLYWDDLLHELTFWQSWVPDTFARVVCNNMWSILELIGTTYTANITQPVCNSWSAAM